VKGVCHKEEGMKVVRYQRLKLPDDSGNIPIEVLPCYPTPTVEYEVIDQALIEKLVIKFTHMEGFTAFAEIPVGRTITYRDFVKCCEFVISALVKQGYLKDTANG
jgi:hypothetical protein